jgi:hypothetical protein
MISLGHYLTVAAMLFTISIEIPSASILPEKAAEQVSGASSLIVFDREHCTIFCEMRI